MSTLLLRLAAPMQSWGMDSKFERRYTERCPTKSGVIGLVAAALGRRRNESIEDLSALRFGVRIDQEGALLRDYHTSKSSEHPYESNRYYLSDAVFLAGLEGDEKFLSDIEQALSFPVFPLFLGRRSCPPEGRVSLGIRKGKALLEALQEEPLLISDWAKKKEPSGEPSKKSLRIVADATEEDTAVYYQRDMPISFDQTHRRFGFRRVFEYKLHSGSDSLNRHTSTPGITAHDPMAELEEG
ncbi:MAG: type I-E CRISPR-associated protein Cas5/CasD [Syntrophomonadaceae bacterium]|nr:type I-E CRISPR-associated protein Cas5/CasD [Syntrophomonadaceae bacterium]